MKSIEEELKTFDYRKVLDDLDRKHRQGIKPMNKNEGGAQLSASFPLRVQETNTGFTNNALQNNLMLPLAKQVQLNNMKMDSGLQPLHFGTSPVIQQKVEMQNPSLLGRVGYWGQSAIGQLTATAPLMAENFIQSNKNRAKDLNNHFYTEALSRVQNLEKEIEDYKKEYPESVSYKQLAEPNDFTYHGPSKSKEIYSPELQNMVDQLKAETERMNLQKNTTPVSSNTFAMKAFNKSNEEREKALHGLEGGERFVASTLMGMGDMALTLPLGGINTNIPLAVMSAKAASQKMGDLNAQGFDASEALSRGLLSGAIEGATEKVPLDDLFKMTKYAPKNLKQALLGTGKQALSEGLQEGVSYLADSTLDYAYKDPNAKIDGMELLANMAGGALSGGLFGGGANTLGALKGNQSPIVQETNFNPQMDNKELMKVEYDNTTGDLLPQYGKQLKQKYDSQEMHMLEVTQKIIPETIKIETPERQQYRINKANEYYEKFNAPNKDKKAYIIIGAPAAGKSTIAEPLAQQTGSMILDSDIIKTGDANHQFEGIPEYKGGIGANAVHDESTLIAENVLNKILDYGDNFVYPKVGKTLEDMQLLNTLLKKMGYEVNLIYNDLPVEKTLQRNAARFKETNRFLNNDYLIGVGKKPLMVYNKLKEQGGFDNYEIYSNDVERGQEPIRIETTAGEKGLLRLRRSGIAETDGLVQTKITRTGYEGTEQDQQVEKSTFFNEDNEQKKSQKIINYENKNFTNFSKYLQQNFGLSRTDVNTLLKNDVLGLKDSIQKTGKIDSNQAKAIFKKAWDFGVTKDTTMHDMYPELIAKLKSTSLNYDMAKRALGQNAFNDFRYESKGLLNINKDGGSIDSLYSELSSEYPSLFDPYIDNEGDQLNAMLDVASELQVTETPLKNSNLRQFQSGYEEDFHTQLNQYLSFMERAEQIQRESKKEAPQGTFDYQTYKDNQTKIKALQREHDRVMREPFTQKELAYADMIINGKITINEVAEGVNKKTVQRIVDVKEPLFKIKNEITEAKKKIKYEYRALAREKTSNMLKWKDKKNGFLFSRETPERNFIDVAGKEDGQVLVDTYITPIHENEAARNRYVSEQFKRIKELGLSKKESEILQQFGEKKIDDNKIIGEGYDLAKIKKADSIFRGMYDEVIELTNEALLRNGYTPIEKLENYYKHFAEEEHKGFRKALEKVGFEWNTDKLPTSIAGLTDTFRPGKTWFSSALHRNGDKTVYDAVKGIETYIQNATDVIYHTDDIQRLRALESEIRYQYSDEYMKAKIDEAYESGETIEDVVNEVNKLTKDDKGNLATWLNQYTNKLANKKLSADRNMEIQVGRGVYSFAQAVESRVAANMVALNPGSWLTNFIPITQATSQIKTKYLIDAMNDTMKNYSTYDGFADKSTFLTNRKGYDPLTQTTLEKAIGIATKPMSYIDDFTSQVVTRAKYKQNLEKGMSEELSIKDADDYAARLIADRSKGAIPLIFEQKNPLTKLFTQFQLEVNNQMSYVLKDMKSYGQEEGAKALAMGLMKLCISAWLYNNVYEALIGRRSATDPIDIALGMTNDFTDPEVSTGTALKNTSSNILQEVPFIGGWLDGGRLPISSAMPDFNNVFKYADAPDNVQKDILKKEGLKSLYYVLPAGGGQIKKMVESAEVLANEGKYKQVSEGEQLQYPVKPTLGNAVKGALFGQYSFPEAREYFDEGNKPLSVKETSGYRVAMKEGIDSDLYIKAIEDIKAIESDKNDKGNAIGGSLGAKKKAYIDSLKLTPFQKQLMYTNFGVDLESEALKKYYEKNLKGMK